MYRFTVEMSFVNCLKTNTKQQRRDISVQLCLYTGVILVSHMILEQNSIAHFMKAESVQIVKL